MNPRLFTIFCLIGISSTVTGQQIPETDLVQKVDNPVYQIDKGPRVAIDEAHYNFHTVNGRYRAFAELIRKDGYRVNGLDESLTMESLEDIDVFVIVNSLNENNEKDWSLPTPSAFTQQEISAVKNWVQQGGSLFLIADHMPFPGAAQDLAKAFGVKFSNGYAHPGHRVAGKTDLFGADTGLCENAITRGRNGSEKVTEVATFGGSAFVPPKGATPILLFGEDSISYETTRAPGITPNAAEVDIEGWCQGAVFPFHEGRVAVFGEAAMFTAQLAGRDRRPMGMNAPEAKQNQQLLLNVMHWLSRVDDFQLAPNRQ